MCDIDLKGFRTPIRNLIAKGFQSQCPSTPLLQCAMCIAKKAAVSMVSSYLYVFAVYANHLTSTNGSRQWFRGDWVNPFEQSTEVRVYKEIVPNVVVERVENSFARMIHWRKLISL